MIFIMRFTSIGGFFVFFACTLVLLCSARFVKADESGSDGGGGDASETDEENADSEDEEDAESEEAGEAEDGPKGWAADVFAQEEYRFRYAAAPTVESSSLDRGGDSAEDLGRGSDQDIRLFLSGTLRDAKDRFLVNASLGLFADVDGFVASGEPSSLSSTNDNASSFASLVPSSSEAVWLDLYTLFGEYHSTKVLALGRIGRQISEHGESITFDGAAFDIRLLKNYWSMFLMGGRSVHFFETDSNLYEDWLFSVGTVIRPIETLKFELEYRLNVEDTATDDALLDGNAASATEKITDHTYGISAWYHFQDLLYLKGRFRGLGSSAAKVGGAVSLDFTPIEFGLDIGVDVQLISYREMNESDNAYFAILGESLPHVNLNAALKKSFTMDKGIYTLHAGLAARMLTKDEPTSFNRDYGRAYVMFDAVDIVTKGPFISAVGEFYYSLANTDQFFSAGGSAGYDGETVRAELGSYYSWVKYIYFADVQEIEDVRTYYVDLKIRPVKWFTIRARYELEQFDRLIHTAMLTLTQVF